MEKIRDRKGLFSLLSSVNESNRDHFSQFGSWLKPQIKVFWLEVNEHYIDRVLEQSGMKLLDRNLYEIIFKDEVFWIDTSNNRIWNIYTLATTDQTNQLINQTFSKLKGVDRTWFTQRFMESIEKQMGFSNRGFGIKYQDTFAPKDEATDFSAKFWLGKKTVQDELLKNIRNKFSISSIRFGRNFPDDKGLSGQLYELYYNGHLTVTASDDFEETFSLIHTIQNFYTNSIRSLEKQNKERPTFVEVTFSSQIDTKSFNSIAETGYGDMKLWLQKYQEEPEISRFSGVDMHTGDFVQIDLADKYSYISTDEKACMNIAPRFGTLSSRYLSTMSTLYHDGVEIFA